MNLVAARAISMGAKRLVSEYQPTKKNGMAREHYTSLGFPPLETRTEGGSLSVRDLAGFVPSETFITSRRARHVSSTEIYIVQIETFQDVFADDDMQLTPDLSAEDVICWDSFK